MRDFAEATRFALTKPEAGGERFIISAGSSVWGQWGTSFSLLVQFNVTEKDAMLSMSYSERGPACLRQVWGASAGDTRGQPEALWIRQPEVARPAWGQVPHCGGDD